ncbi:MAG: hypothetical protein JWM74_3405 [Myxococcaceae bacterium]|nr:hypothetical protein [Myxococcaceae bacterium]
MVRGRWFRDRASSAALAALAATIFGALAFGSGCKPDPLARRLHLFQDTCARCHGQDGHGGEPIGGPGGPVPRNFHDEAFQKARTDAELHQVIEHGKGSMPSFKTTLSDHDIDELIVQVRTFGANR